MKLSNDRMLKIEEVAELLAVSVPTLYAMRREGKFPEPCRLGVGGRSSRWRLSDVQKWISER